MVVRQRTFSQCFPESSGLVINLVGGLAVACSILVTPLSLLYLRAPLLLLSCLFYILQHLSFFIFIFISSHLVPSLTRTNPCRSKVLQSSWQSIVRALLEAFLLASFKSVGKYEFRASLLQLRHTISTYTLSLIPPTNFPVELSYKRSHSFHQDLFNTLIDRPSKRFQRTNSTLR